MIPTIRLRPESPVDTLPTLKAAAMDAAQAATEFAREAAHLTEASRRMGARCAEESSSLTADLKLNQVNAAMLLEAAAATDADLAARLAELYPARGESLAHFNQVAASCLEAMRQVGGLLQRETAGLGRNWEVLDAAARQRQREMGSQLRSMADLLRALVAEQRSVHASLTKLAAHIGEEERAVRQEESARKHAEALRLTNAGCGALQRGSLEQAQSLFEAAWQQHATPQTAFNFALALLLSGHMERARRLLEDPVLRTCSPVEVQILKAMRALLARDLPTAAREAETGLAASPDHPMLKQILAAAAFMQSPVTALQQPNALPDGLRDWLAKEPSPAAAA